jgi:hypothetical protein
MVDLGVAAGVASSIEEGLLMRKAITLVCVLLFGVFLSYGQSRDTGKGQGAIVVRQDAPFYKNSQGPAVHGKMDKGTRSAA